MSQHTGHRGQGRRPGRDTNEGWDLHEGRERLEDPDLHEDRDRRKAHEGKKGHDVVLLYNQTENGDGYRALRSRPGKVELAEIRPLVQGKPILSADVVRLHEREGSPLLWDVEVQYSPREDAPSVRAGPPRVSSALYRNNWDIIFGKNSTGPVDQSKLN